MTFNFLLRNAVAFRDRRLHGWRLASRLLMFYLGCSVGVLINVRLAESLYTVGMPWYLAGISGMVVSSIWNYGVIVAMAWRRNRVFTVS
jgi:dolichol-phosphate mannosyltransferase